MFLKNDAKTHPFTASVREGINPPRSFPAGICARLADGNEDYVFIMGVFCLASKNNLSSLVNKACKFTQTHAKHISNHAFAVVCRFKTPDNFECIPIASLLPACGAQAPPEAQAAFADFWNTHSPGANGSGTVKAHEPPARGRTVRRSGGRVHGVRNKQARATRKQPGRAAKIKTRTTLAQSKRGNGAARKCKPRHTKAMSRSTRNQGVCDAGTQASCPLEVSCNNTTDPAMWHGQLTQQQIDMCEALGHTLGTALAAYNMHLRKSISLEKPSIAMSHVQMID